MTVSCWPPKPHLQGGVSWPVLPQEDDGPPLGSSSSLSPCHTQQPLHISPRMVAIIRALMERCRFSFPNPHTYGGTSSQHRCVGHPGGVTLGLACAGFKSSGTYAPHRCPAVKEMIPIILAAGLWGHHWAGLHDNTVASSKVQLLPSYPLHDLLLRHLYHILLHSCSQSC